MDRSTFTPGTGHQFVADGEARFVAGVQPEIQLAVEKQFSGRLANAGWLARLFIRREMRREIQRRVSEQIPSEYTVW